MIQQLRNAVVAPTGMGKNYGRIMPLLRQGWLVRQKIMHYGFFGQCFSGCLCSQEETQFVSQNLHLQGGNWRPYPAVLISNGSTLQKQFYFRRRLYPLVGNTTVCQSRLQIKKKTNTNVYYRCDRLLDCLKKKS